MPSNEENENKNIEHETIAGKWTFRIIAVIVIMAFCCIVIHVEFNNMKKNDITRESALQIANQITRSIEALQDAWNTIYYFYQTGNLFKILKCSSMSSTKQTKQKNILLRLYDEKICDNNTNCALKNSNTSEKDIDSTNKNDDDYVRCGSDITINIGLKDEVYKHPTNYKKYTFSLGSEPLEILENYPFVKHALATMKIGERTTFIAIPMEQKILKQRRQTMYEIAVHTDSKNKTGADNKQNSNNIPLYFPIREGNEKFVIDDRITCGSIVSFIYDIYDINGKKIGADNEINKIKVGSKKLSVGIEQLMLRMSVGDRYKIFVTKNMHKNTDFFPSTLFNDRDAIIFDISIVNVQN